MSTILNELVKIREKLDSDGTYSGYTAGVPETVTQIRELVENGAGSGGGSGVTVFPVKYEGSDGYVEVSETELLNALKSGVVIFRDAYEENGEFAGTTDYYVSSVSSGMAYSMFPNYTTVTVASWNYSNGRYEGPSY